MQVTPRTLMTAICLSLSTLASTTYSVDAQPADERPIIALPPTAIRRNPSQDVPAGVKYVNGEGLKRAGRIVVGASGRLVFSGNSDLSGLQIENYGTIELRGRGLMLTDDTTHIENHGRMVMSNGSDITSMSKNLSLLENFGTIVVKQGTGGATIHGNVMNHGCILVNAEDEYGSCPDPVRPAAAMTSDTTEPGPKPDVTPTPMLVAITGTFGTSSSVFQTTITSTSYGQLWVNGPVGLNGGRLHCVLNPTSVRPSNDLHVIVGSTITGNPGDFTSWTCYPSTVSYTHLIDRTPATTDNYIVKTFTP